MLIAKSTIFYHNHQYLPGDILPEESEEKSKWIECDSAYEVKEPVKKPPKAKRRSAKSGLEGKAAGDLETDDNLVGQIPDNPVRKRK